MHTTVFNYIPQQSPTLRVININKLSQKLTNQFNEQKMKASFTYLMYSHNIGLFHERNRDELQGEHSLLLLKLVLEIGNSYPFQ